jgi:eukaryotic translation initiation factor 2C
VKLRANFFPVKVPKRPLYEYDVAITPTAGTTVRRVRRRIFQLAESSREWATSGLKGLVAHDHSSKLIAAKQLPQPLTVKVAFYEEDEDGPKAGGKEYTLTIKFIQTLETQSLLKCVLFGHMWHLADPLLIQAISEGSHSIVVTIYCP